MTMDMGSWKLIGDTDAVKKGGKVLEESKYLRARPASAMG